jgi:hypothetical protein
MRPAASVAAMMVRVGIVAQIVAERLSPVESLHPAASATTPVSTAAAGSPIRGIQKVQYRTEYHLTTPCAAPCSSRTRRATTAVRNDTAGYMSMSSTAAITHLPRFLLERSTAQKLFIFNQLRQQEVQFLETNPIGRAPNLF